MAQSSDEKQIRNLVKTWVQAVCDGNLEGIIAHHTPDMVIFDVPAPLQRKGLDEYRKAWELYFQYTSGGEGTFEVTDLELFVGDTVAFGHSPLHVAGGTARLTLGFRKIDDAWYIAHEHHSFAADAA